MINIKHVNHITKFFLFWLKKKLLLLNGENSWDFVNQYEKYLW